MSKLDFHTISELKLKVRVLVFSLLNLYELTHRLTRRKLEETMHVHVRYLSQDSTFDLF